MSKKEKIENTEEFVYYEEHYEEMMREMYADQGIQDFEIPEDWDKEFRAVIDKAFAEEERRQKYRSIRRGCVTAAAFLGVVGLLKCAPVAGAGIKEVFQSTFSLGEREYITFGTNKDVELDSEINQQEIFFDTESMDVAYEQIRKELPWSMLWLGYIPEGFKLTEARYNKMYRILNLTLEKEGKLIYISQQRVFDENGAGLVIDNKKGESVINTNLQQEIFIANGERDDSLVFSLQNDNLVMAFNGVVSLEECKKIAENIYYK